MKSKISCFLRFPYVPNSCSECLGVLGLAWACLGVLGRAWACLGVLGRTWACLGVLGRAWEVFHVLICYMFLLLVSSYI